MELYQQLEKVKTKQDVVRFINALRKDLKNNKDEWQNWSLDDYLGAVEAWLNDSEGVVMNSGKAVEDLPKWELIATVLYSGKIYE